MEILTAIFAVFDSVSAWLIGALNDVTAIFYNSTDNQLTMLGVLAVVGLAISVIFLVIGIIQKFLHFRG